MPPAPIGSTTSNWARRVPGDKLTNLLSKDVPDSFYRPAFAVPNGRNRALTRPLANCRARRYSTVPLSPQERFQPGNDAWRPGSPRPGAGRPARLVLRPHFSQQGRRGRSPPRGSGSRHEGDSRDDDDRPTEHWCAAAYVGGGRRQPRQGAGSAVWCPSARLRPQARAARGTAGEGDERSPRRREEAPLGDRRADPAGGRVAERPAEERAGRALDSGKGPRARAE